MQGATAMIQIKIEDAQEQLPELTREEVIIVADDTEGKELVRLAPIGKQHARKAGSAKGLFTMSDDFDDLIPDFDEYQ
jgi:antitoxin (DNA-binding transcriptional repressor) of toxin-antitoxin stability system